jgi:hypothetical protein
MAQIILDFTTNQTTRMAPAFGEKVGHPGTDATITEVHDYLMQFCKDTVFNYEERKSIVTLPPPPPFT